MGIFDKIKLVGANVIDAGKEAVSSAVETTSSVAKSGAEAVSSAAGSVADFSKEAVSSAVETTSSVAKAGAEAVSSAAGSVADFSKEVALPILMSALQKLEVKHLRTIITTLKPMAKGNKKVTNTIILVEVMIENIAVWQNSTDENKDEKLLLSLDALKQTFDLNLVLTVLEMFASFIPGAKLLIFILRMLL
jgi:hypothetical protein